MIPLGHAELLGGKVEFWSSDLDPECCSGGGGGLKTVPSGCPVPVPAPAGMAPAGPLAGAVGRARLPHAAQPSLPESPRAGKALSRLGKPAGNSLPAPGLSSAPELHPQFGKRGLDHPKTEESPEGLPRVSTAHPLPPRISVGYGSTIPHRGDGVGAGLVQGSRMCFKHTK